MSVPWRVCLIYSVCACACERHRARDLVSRCRHAQQGAGGRGARFIDPPVGQHFQILYELNYKGRYWYV